MWTAIMILICVPMFAFLGWCFLILFEHALSVEEQLEREDAEQPLYTYEPTAPLEENSVEEVEEIVCV
jgi:hypothetical protein